MALNAISVRKTMTATENPHRASRLPAAALQNAVRMLHGTVSATETLPCIDSGALAKMNPRSKALTIGNGKHATELLIRIPH